MRAALFKSLFLSLLVASAAGAQTRTNLENQTLDSRRNSLIICSQNLKNYLGESPRKPQDPPGPVGPSDKEQALINRFDRAACDVIGVQELGGMSDDIAQRNLQRLATLLYARTQRRFSMKIGDVNENAQRNAFLVADDKAHIVHVVTYRKLFLPKIDPTQKPRLFTRSPLEIQITVDGKDGRMDKNISLLNFHFKSKSGSKDDPAALQWETYRMEMSEGIRRVAEDRFKAQIQAGEPVILLGDRNAHNDTATAKILEGSLTLDDFKAKSRCRLSKRGTPLCQGDTRRPISFMSLLTYDPETSKLPGTFVYNKVFSFLDDILINVSAINFTREDPDAEGNYMSGIINTDVDASDHALVWSKLAW